jgi:hypothetical protein
LFHTRNNVLLRAFPLEHSQQFNTVPQLLGARMTMEQVRMRRRVWSNGRGRADDRLWMMTDALAQWCLAEAEAGGNPWHELESLLAGSRQSAEPPSAGTGPGREGAIGCRADPGMDAADSGMGAATGLSSGAAFQAPGNSPVAPDDHFSSWIGARRRSGRLRNDDVTLVAILL